MREKTSAADVLLHPQRLAIVRELAGEQLTTKQLAARLPEIPQATLYRHLGALLDAGIVVVVAERKVRGTPERTFALGEGAVITQDQLEHATGADHFRYFATWVAGLLDEFGRYTRRERIDVIADGVGYRDHVLHLTDEELRELLAEIRAAIAARAEHAPRPDRTARLLSTVTMPVDRPESEGPHA